MCEVYGDAQEMCRQKRDAVMQSGMPHLEPARRCWIGSGSCPRSARVASMGSRFSKEQEAPVPTGAPGGSFGGMSGVQCMNLAARARVMNIVDYIESIQKKSPMARGGWATLQRPDLVINGFSPRLAR